MEIGVRRKGKVSIVDVTGKVTVGDDHVRLRDTTKERLQVRVGQGLVEYGKLIQQLGKYRYDRALSVDILPMPEVDQNAELRKIRLLLESLL